MASEYKEPETEDELIEAMHSIFNTTESSIEVKLFRTTMTKVGEKLTDDELSDLFKELKMNLDENDSFNFEEFIRAILTR